MEDGGSDGAGTDAGDNIILDGTDTALSDAGGRVQGEDGATSYVALDTPTNTVLKNGTDDYALTAVNFKSLTTNLKMWKQLM